MQQKKRKNQHSQTPAFKLKTTDGEPANTGFIQEVKSTGRGYFLEGISKKKARF